jgi:xylulokinase
MSDTLRVLACDLGTTGVKTCVYSIESSGARLLASASAEYSLRFLANGGVEQDVEEWWAALGRTTRLALDRAGAKASEIRGMAFCCQMQGLVLVDESGAPVRPAMSYMDQRGVEQKRHGIEGGIEVAGMNLWKLLPSLAITGGASASVKDPLWKYHWVKDEEPEAFARTRKWLDVKEYLVMRCTGRACMTPDSANATFLYDTRPGRLGWSPLMCRIFDVDMGLLPEVIGAAEVAGPLLPLAASELGLEPGTPVFGGGGDLSLIALGSGAVGLERAHVYMGTSGWVASVTDRRVVDTDAMIASVIGAVPGRYNYMSEQETAGKCLEWVRDHLALDEIDVYLEKRTVADDPDRRYDSLFDLLSEKMEEVPAGSEGLVFAPWLHGNRSPFEDPAARGIFFNIGVETGKRAMIRAVVEGVANHSRWQLDSIRRKTAVSGPLRFVGGGARSPQIAQVFADVLGETIETTESPQNAGALGAALLCAAGLGAIGSLAEAGELVPASASYGPRPGNRAVYDRQFEVFKGLYRSNRRGFRALNETMMRGA